MIFIVHKQEKSGAHNDKVGALSKRLRGDGFACICDQDVSQLGTSWEQWGERNISEARIVLVYCTEAFHRAWHEEGHGGVPWEAMLIQNVIALEPRSPGKFIAVIEQEADRRFVPLPLYPAHAICLADEGYQKLLDRLRNRGPALEPPNLAYKADRSVHYPLIPPKVVPAVIATAPGPRSKNLPKELPFWGRDQELRLIGSALSTGRRAAVLGPSGAGKTATLRMFAHSITGRWWAVVWIEARSILSLSDLCDEIARTVDADYVLRLPRNLKESEIRKILGVGGRQALLVIPDFDLFTDTEVLRFLETSTAPCHVLLATEVGVSNSVTVELAPMTEAEAMGVAQLEVNSDDTGQLGLLSPPERLEEVLRELCILAGNLPLAVRWAVSAFRNGIRLDPSRLGIEELFLQVVTKLPEDNQSMLAALAFIKESIPLETIAGITAFELPVVEAALRKLVDLRLVEAIETSEVQRYRLQSSALDLMKRYSGMFGAHDGAFSRRLVRHTLSSIGHHSAQQRDREWSIVRRALAVCRGLRLGAEFVKLHIETYHMLWSRGHWDENLANAEEALRYTNQLRMPKDRAWILMECIGWTHFCRGEYEQAEEHYKEAAELGRSLDKLEAQRLKARLCNYFGRLYAAQKQYQKALDQLWMGLRHCEDDETESFLESALGDVYSAIGDFSNALAHFTVVLKKREMTGDRFRLCSVQCDLGELAIDLGNFLKAREFFGESLDTARVNNRLEIMARCHLGIGFCDACENRGDAKRGFRDALELFGRLGREREIERVEKLISRVESGGFSRPASAATIPARADVEVLLINAPREAEMGSHRCQDHRMPLGLMSIATYLKKRGIAVQTLDAEAASIGVAGILDRVASKKPRIVGVNCHTLNRFVVYEIARGIKFIAPQTITVLGGAHPALAPRETLHECPQVDIVVAGEGERTMYEICSRPDALAVPGTWYRAEESGREIRNGGEMPRIHDLDRIGFPDLSDVPFETYVGYEEKELPGLWRRAYLNATRGCRYRCTYCTEHKFWGGGVTARSAENVFAEIRQLADRGVGHFYFYDDTFNDWAGLLDFCNIMASQRPGIKWSCSSRIDKIDEKVVSAMYEGGCREIAFGIESGSGASLEKMKKGLQLGSEVRVAQIREEIGRRVEICAEQGVKPRTHFMIGFPWEGRDDITATVEFAVELKSRKLEDANFFVVKRYPGTTHDQGFVNIGTTAESFDVWSVYDWYRVSNQKSAAKLKRFNDIPKVSMHPDLDSLQLRRLVRNAYDIFFGQTTVPQVDSELWRGVFYPSAPARGRGAVGS